MSGPQSGSFRIASAPGCASIYTAAATGAPPVEAVVVSNGKITAIGSTDQCSIHSVDKHIDLLPEQVVLPGFIDSHLHFLELGENILLDISRATSLQECIDMVADFVEHKAGKEEIIRLTGWSHNGWSDTKGRLPTADDLEGHPTLQGRKIILQSRDCHAQWVSRAILEHPVIASNVARWVNDKRAKEEKGGVLTVKEEGGAEGVFIDNAQRLVFDRAANDLWYTKEQLDVRFDNAVKMCLSLGITTVNDCGLRPWSVPYYEDRVAAEGPLPIRVYAMVYTEPSNPNFVGIPLKGNHCSLDGDRLSVRGVKLFTDGAMRSGGARLVEPYANDPTNRGMLLAPLPILEAAIANVVSLGKQVVTHAIGDEGNRDALMAYTKVDGIEKLRPRIEHAQIVNPADIELFVRSNVIASVQPGHAHGDMDIAIPCLGRARAYQRLYLLKSLIERGIKCALGTDSPVEPIQPMNTFLSAVSERRDGSGQVWPNEALTRAQTLTGMTLDAAFACFSDDIVGSLEAGKTADIIVLDRDIMKVAQSDLIDMSVVKTFLDGVAVYDSSTSM